MSSDIFDLKLGCKNLCCLSGMKRPASQRWFSQRLSSNTALEGGVFPPFDSFQTGSYGDTAPHSIPLIPRRASGTETRLIWEWPGGVGAGPWGLGQGVGGPTTPLLLAQSQSRALKAPRKFCRLLPWSYYGPKRGGGGGVPPPPPSTFSTFPYKPDGPPTPPHRA